MRRIFVLNKVQGMYRHCSRPNHINYRLQRPRRCLTGYNYGIRKEAEKQVTRNTMTDGAGSGRAGRQDIVKTKGFSSGVRGRAEEEAVARRA